jgi:hypothetical protein
VVVSGKAEMHFAKDGMANDNERRYYYFGTDIPDADRVGSMFGQTPSPTKNKGFVLSPFNTPSRRRLGLRKDERRRSVGGGEDSEHEGSFVLSSPPSSVGLASGSGWAVDSL